MRPTSASKPCARGFVHAIIRGSHKCLRRGQACARALDRHYHRYGFHCHGIRLAVARRREPAPPGPPPPPVVGAADLSVTVADAPDPVRPGAALTYTIVVANAGPDPARDVVLRAPAQADVPVVGVSATQGSCIGAGQVSCTLGGIASGAAATVTVRVTVPLSATQLTFAAFVTSPLADPNRANNTATATTAVS